MDTDDFKKKVQNIEEWLKKELSSIRTGRATVSLLDSVMVDSYGTKTPLNQTANISVEDPKTIRIAPWDKSLIPEIEKGVTVADLGVSTSVDDEGVRVIFPDLTTETREKLVKQAKSKIEEAKVSVRNDRSKIIKEVESNQKSGEFAEDDVKRFKEDIDKIVRETNDGFDNIGKNKESEIMN